MTTKMLSIPEVAHALGVSPRWVRRAVIERRLPYVKVGRLVRFESDDVEAFIASNRIAAHA